MKNNTEIKYCQTCGIPLDIGICCGNDDECHPLPISLVYKRVYIDPQKPFIRLHFQK